MAGTLLSAPTLGASDWSSWITLVDAVRRGYMAASYTNFSGSAESALAAGSLVEVAGAVYSFTETAINYTGAGSVNSDLYIYVKPDAVVSTATVVAWGSAPVWVSAKQGFYASAASTTRAIGGIYVAAAGSYQSKYLYTGELLNYCLLQNVTRPVLREVVSIGEWNMDATPSKIIICNALTAKTRNIQIIIFSDTGATGYPLNYAATAGISAGWWYNGGGAINCGRLTAGTFDSAGYDGTASTVANRGYVYIEYEA